ncbi:MAG: Transposase family protein [Verrucomicrobiales bacterium]|nr:Transposase family protein [Verrucomicrobiales bacterium]
MAGDRDELENLSVTELVSLVRRLLGRVEALEKENASLREQLRAAKRPGAPFSKGPGPGTPKKPGRHQGKGWSERPGEPVPGPADQFEELSAPLDSPDCPQCGARLEMSERAGTVEDTPAQPVRIIRRFRVEHGACAVCGWSGRGRHADLASGQHGATAHGTGPQVMARALTLHYHDGLPLCKVPAVIRAATGIALSQSALTQAAAALCAPGAVLRTAYDGLREAVRTSPVVNTADTGWRIGGAAAFFIGFFTPLLAVFQLRRRHRDQEVVEMPGACFAGLLGTDRSVSYDAEALDSIEQQKCLSHLLKNLSAAEETKTGRAKAFTRELKATLREAVKLWRDHREQACAPEQYRQRGRMIRQRIDRQLRDRRLRDPDNQRLLDGIGLQHDNGRVLLFLERPEMKPTNNRAERGLRGAVIARKVSHCSKNERGARTCEVMKSITATLALRGHQVSSALAGMISGRPMPKAVAR